jgi:putative ABC transport system ATP-binding protein
MIHLEHVTKTFDGFGSPVTAIHDVSLHVDAGEFVAIVGPSGSGKSTLLQILGCLDVPSSGRYRLNGSDVSSLDDDALSRLRNEYIGFVFQSFNLIPRTTARENVETPLLYGAPGNGADARVDEVLGRVGMLHRAKHYPEALSGGEQQRVAIARAIVNRPKLLIADEPTGNLDQQTGAEIMRLFGELHRDGLTVVLVTHDPQVATAAGRVVSLVDGMLDSSADAAARPVSATPVAEAPR